MPCKRAMAHKLRNRTKRWAGSANSRSSTHATFQSQPACTLTARLRLHCLCSSTVNRPLRQTEQDSNGNHSRLSPDEEKYTMALMPLNCWNRKSMTPMRAARLDSTSPHEGSPAPPSLCLAATGGWAGACWRGDGKLGSRSALPNELTMPATPMLRL